jgi:hypothetical protein
VTAFALALGLALAAPAAAAPAQAPRADLSARPPASAAGGHASGETRCAACHTTEDWKRVTFGHDRTGFPLTGRHREVTCSACHPGSDFARPVPKACAACHRDVHAQRLGQRCDRCHDTGTFKQASFGPGDHRKTAFPLDGRHAALPCDQCHGDRRDRDFARGVVRCGGCHQQDYDRTQADPRLLNHVSAGFTTDCRGCHGTWRFSPATFAGHDVCFAIRTGPHAGIRCKDCHRVAIPVIPPGGVLTCSATPAGAPPADCKYCHHNYADHPNVGPAYQNAATSNSACYLCHPFSNVGSGSLRRGGVR